MYTIHKSINQISVFYQSINKKRKLSLLPKMLLYCPAHTWTTAQ